MLYDLIVSKFGNLSWEIGKKTLIFNWEYDPISAKE